MQQSRRLWDRRAAEEKSRRPERAVKHVDHLLKDNKRQSHELHLGEIRADRKLKQSNQSIQKR